MTGEESSEDTLQYYLCELFQYTFGLALLLAIDFAIFYYAAQSYLVAAIRFVLTGIELLYLIAALIALHEIQKKLRTRPRARYVVAVFNGAAAAAFVYLLLQVAAWDLTFTYTSNSPVFTHEFLERLTDFIGLAVKVFLGLVFFVGFMYSLNQISQIVLNREVDGNGA